MWACSGAVPFALAFERMNMVATTGASADAPELKACAKFTRKAALDSGPRIAAYGFAEVCKAHTPVANRKIAPSVRGKLTELAAGMKASAPSTMMNREITMVFL